MRSLILSLMIFAGPMGFAQAEHPWADHLVSSMASVNSEAPLCQHSPLKIITSTSRMTAYYPGNSSMEGGNKDRYGNRLYTLQQFLAGKAPYVSVAMDYKGKMKKYQKKYLCIPTIEKDYADEIDAWREKHPKHYMKYQGRIPFKVVDTGGAFYNKGLSKIDICVANRKAAMDKRLQKKAVLQDCDPLFKK